ncbi:VOC family protein [Thauera humireducens]|uniref:VOC family protein n=1 Tax=Thauera humireducens TaxID=1134435 RepID=UPI00311E54C7
MIDLQDVRYVRLRYPDIEAAIDFACKVVGLELVRREQGCAYFRSDSKDHTLVYFEGDPRDHTLAFEVARGDVLDAAGAELERAGMAVHEGSAEECELRRVKRFIRFRDLTGNAIELVWRPHASGRRYFRRGMRASPASAMSACARPTRRVTSASGPRSATHG